MFAIIVSATIISLSAATVIGIFKFTEYLINRGVTNTLYINTIPGYYNINIIIFLYINLYL